MQRWWFRLAIGAVTVMYLAIVGVLLAAAWLAGDIDIAGHLVATAGVLVAAGLGGWAIIAGFIWYHNETLTSRWEAHQREYERGRRDGLREAQAPTDHR